MAGCDRRHGRATYLAVPPRIFPGPWSLDKLPAWLTLPAGGIIGAVAGYRIARSEHGAADVVMLALLAVAILWAGLTAPRAIPTRPRRARSDKP
jgi:hypothetical protein